MTSAAIGTVLEGTKGNMTADDLILVNLSSVDCRPCLKAMRDAGQPWHEEVVENLAKAKLMLQDQPHAHALICYESPERQVASCIDNDRAPSQALANWVNQVNALLDLYQEHYHRLTLVGKETLYNNPKAVFEHLVVRSGIALGRVTPEQPDESTKPELSEHQPSVLHQLLAMQALQSPQAQRLAKELEASSLPLAELPPLLDQLDELYDQHRGWLAKVPDSTVEELEQLVAELDGLKAEKSLWSKDRTKLTADLEKLRKANEKSVTVDPKLQAKLDDLQQENDLVIEQLHKTQEELEQYLLGNRGGSQKIEKLERDIRSKNEKLHHFSQKNKRLTEQLKASRQELKNLRNSKSWKVTVPLRGVMKLLGGNKGGGA